MKTALRWWMDFLFAPQAPTNLGLSRLCFYGGLLLLLGPLDFSHWGDVSLWGDVSDVFWMPLPAFEVLHLRPLPPGMLGGLQAVWKGALALSCAGLFTRSSTAVSFLLGFYLLGLPHNMGKVHHFDAPVVLILGILMWSRCGDAWSLDRLLRRRLRPLAPSPGPSGEYTWPIRLVWLVLSLVFFAAGTAKLRNGGLAWVFSDNLSLLLIQAQYHQNNATPVSSWGLYLAAYPGLCHLFAAGTILVETGYPLALVSRRLRPFLVASTILLLIGIRVLMGPTFEAVMLCHVFWVPWDHLLRRTGRRSAGYT